MPQLPMLPARRTTLEHPPQEPPETVLVAPETDGLMDEAQEAGAWYLSGPPKRRAKSPRGCRRRRSRGESLPDSECVRLADHKAEWVIPNVSAKLANATKGCRWLSPSFSLYGCEDLGLVLYPAGNASAKPGYLSGPPKRQ